MLLSRLDANMPPPEATSDAEAVRFEVALAELDLILRELEDGTTSLDDALARYERGISLLRTCYGQLQNAEQRIKLLAGMTEDGSPHLKPFEHVASIEVAKVTVKKTVRRKEPTE